MVRRDPSTVYHATPHDVIRLGRDNATVRACLDAWERGHFHTWEQAMTACVCYLADQNNRLTERAVLQDITRPIELTINDAEEMRKFTEGFSYKPKPDKP